MWSEVRSSNRPTRHKVRGSTRRRSQSVRRRCRRRRCRDAATGRGKPCARHCEGVKTDCHDAAYLREGAILVRGVVIATKVRRKASEAANTARHKAGQSPAPLYLRCPRAHPAPHAAPRVRRLLRRWLLRTVLRYYLRWLGGAGQHVGGLETAYGVGQIVGAIACGRLSDSRSRKLCCCSRLPAPPWAMRRRCRRAVSRCCCCSRAGCRSSWRSRR